MNRSDLYRFAVLNNWRKGREKYPRPNPYEDGSEFDDEFDEDEFEFNEDEFELNETGIDQVFDIECDGKELTVAANDLFNDDGDDESESDEKCMMELKAELPMFDEDDESEDGFDDDECDEVVEKEVVDKADDEVFYCKVVSDVVVDEKVKEDFTSDACVYPTYLFTEEMIARLYKLDTVHDKDSIAYGIPDSRLENHDGFFKREMRDYYDISDIDLNITEHAEKKIKKKGCFIFFSRIFSRFFKKQ